MALNPDIKALLATMPAINLDRVTVDGMRAFADRPTYSGPLIHLPRVEQLRLPLKGRTLDARLYVPRSSGDVPPLTVFFHGGGWVSCTIDTHDATVRALARASGSAILSVAYRRAPEHPYPAAIEDGFEALCWAAANGEELGVDCSRLAVAGDSAGGNIAAAVAILARDRHGPILRHQLLAYPVTDRQFSRRSYDENGGGQYLLSTDMMRWYWDQYLGRSARKSAPLAFVQRHPNLAGLPAATLIVAEYDPLRDEGLAFADRLVQAGVPVHAEIAHGMIHGFLSMFDVAADARAWMIRVGKLLKEALA